MHSFSYHEGTGILHVAISGHLTPAEASRYFAERALHRKEARRRSGQLRMLIDASSLAVQSADVANRFPIEFNEAIQSPKDKIAIISGSALFKLQVKRAIATNQIRLFASTEQALDWLSAE